MLAVFSVCICTKTIFPYLAWFPVWAAHTASILNECHCIVLFKPEPEVLTGSLTDVIIICVLYAMSPDDLKQSEEIRTTESFLYLLKIKFFIS